MRWFNFLRTVSVVGFGATLVSGCGEEDVDSDAIKTKGMHAIITAVASGNGETVVTAQLRVGGDNGTIVELSSGDTLVGTVDGETKTLGAIEDREKYRATFDTDAADTEIQVSFEREEDEDAPDSSVTLPDPFSILDLEEEEVQRGDDVLITWEPEGSGDINWSLDGDCVWTADGTTSDDGSHTLTAEDVEVLGTDEGENCEVTVTLERAASGSVDPAFEEGGTIRAYQRRSVSFTSTPGPGEPGTGTGGSGNATGGTSSTGGNAAAGAGEGGSGNASATGGAGGATGEAGAVNAGGSAGSEG